MRSVLAGRAQKRRLRSSSLNAVPPPQTAEDYLPELAIIAASILYRSPVPSQSGLPVYVLNAAAFPDAFQVDYDSLLPYVLARLPSEDELLSGTEYEVVFFAGGQPESATAEKKTAPKFNWYIQAYYVLSRATRKKLQKLYIVHERTWVRVLTSIFGTIVSPKFRRKIVHVGTLSGLALQVPIENLLIPPSVYLNDRRLSPDIFAPYASGKRAFGAKQALPKSIEGSPRLPRVLRETTSFLCNRENIKTEGLFRIPPHSVLASVLREAYDRGQKFVVWKERGVTVVQPGIGSELLDEVQLADAYGVNLAAGLIKSWYRELRQPIFPESSYVELRAKYQDPDTTIPLANLEDLIAPTSETSPLSSTTRQIVTRHFLPLLSLVARHEEQNKMNPENLAICFAPALVCGSNQLEDAKMTSVVRRILQAAIQLWPQGLREACGIDEAAFAKDLQTPQDLREYEDPLEEDANRRYSEDDAVEGREPHRIIMTDDEKFIEKPALPPRPRAASSAAESPDNMTGPELPKRKPAPPLAVLPRYSMIMAEDTNGAVADSPASYTPADGFGPPRRANWSFDEDEKRGFPADEKQALPSAEVAALAVPKRKALTTEQMRGGAVFPATARSASDSSAFSASGNVATRAAAVRQAQIFRKPVMDEQTVASANSYDGVAGDEAFIFRKPSLPASARQKGESNTSSLTSSRKSSFQSLAGQILPSQSPTTATHTTSQINVPGLTAPSLPRPRAPSPGLLKRMSSMEPATDVDPDNKALLAPRRLNMKKASVDNLRRLYEERAGTVQGLAKVDAVRRTSSQT